MINSWTLKNFKSVKDLNKLDLAPLTIFAGANSSGKSTILQSILLTAQTLQNSVKSKSVILNGHISRFGTFSDILSNNPEDRNIVIGLDIDPPSEIDNEVAVFHRTYITNEIVKRITCEFSFTDTVDDISSELLQLQPKLARTKLEAYYDDGTKYLLDVVRTSKSIDDRVNELKINENSVSKIELNSLEYEVRTPFANSAGLIFEHDISNAIKKVVGAYLNHFIPSSLSYIYDKIEQEKIQFIERLISQRYLPIAKERNMSFNRMINDNVKEIIINCAKNATKGKTAILKSAKKDESVEKLIDEPTFENIMAFKKLLPYGRIFSQKLDEEKHKIKAAIVSLKKDDFRLTSSLEDVDFGNYIENYFRRYLKYLGPLRDEPKPVYPLSGAFDPRDIGFKGENTASVLETNKNAPISYIPSICFERGEPLEPQNSTLINAILDWLQYMGVANKVDTSDKGKLGHELKISSKGSDYLHDLTHVGVGVSQVLPILVLSLLAEKSSTLIFEQPELHLHPKVQTRLADFFVSMTILNKQCIVETHSEYLINRLRYRSAISEDDDISKDIIIYFVEKESNSSVYKKVLINKYGVIEDWPKGFFDENEENASKMLRAAMDKKRKERNNNTL